MSTSHFPLLSLDHDFKSSEDTEVQKAVMGLRPCLNCGLKHPQFTEKAKVPRPWSSNKVTPQKHKGATSQGEEERQLAASMLNPQQLSIQTFPQKTKLCCTFRKTS